MHSQGREVATLPSPERFYRLGGFVVSSLMDFAFKDVAKDDGLETARTLIKQLNQHYETLGTLLPKSADSQLTQSLQPRSRKKINWADEQFKEQDEAQCQGVSLPAMLSIIQFYACYLKVKDAIENNTKVQIDDNAHREFRRAQKFFSSSMKLIKCDVLPGYTALRLHEDYSQAGPIIQKEFLNPNVQRLQEILGIASVSSSDKAKPSVAGHFSAHRRSQRQSVHELVVKRRHSTIFST